MGERFDAVGIDAGFGGLTAARGLARSGAVNRGARGRRAARDSKGEPMTMRTRSGVEGSAGAEGGGPWAVFAEMNTGRFARLERSTKGESVVLMGAPLRSIDVSSRGVVIEFGDSRYRRAVFAGPPAHLVVRCDRPGHPVGLSITTTDGEHLLLSFEPEGSRPAPAPPRFTPARAGEREGRRASRALAATRA